MKSNSQTEPGPAIPCRMGTGVSPPMANNGGYPQTRHELDVLAKPTSAAHPNQEEYLSASQTI
jgi:hypothetical protein